MTEPAILAETAAAKSARAETRLLWIGLAVLLAVGVVAIASFGYPALILIALALTLGVFALLLAIMRG
ncbi:MAG: hypothetical protein U1E34_07115 [Amaricoccus sp.]